MPRPTPHPDPDTLAAHVERRLPPPEAAAVDEHLAYCSDCFDTFSESARFVLDEEPADVPHVAPARPATVLPFVKRPAFRMAAILAIAVGGLLLFQQILGPLVQRNRQPLVAELAAALGTTRFIEPRLTGGFQHGRYVVVRAGDSSKSLDAHSPAVLAAVARIREKTANDTAPEALRALAATYLVSGDIGRAVKALESATAQDPKDPRLKSDLAAAYLVRATRLDEPADLPKALETAEGAIALGGAPPEAWFNRALALEALRLGEAARKAWSDYLERDASSPWADEARQHVEDLERTRQSTVDDDRARARAALTEGGTAVERLADENPSILADYFYSELLTSWADAQLTGKPHAIVLRNQARVAGDALMRATSDAMPRDTAAALVSAPSAASRDPPRTQALGFKALEEAQRLFDRGEPSCDAFRQSRHLLQDGGSPYAAWARERAAVACFLILRAPGVLPELSELAAVARPKRYGKLLGRALWMTALFYSDGGDFDRAIELYGAARDVFRSLRDAELEAAVAIRHGYVLRVSGDSRAGWHELVRALTLLDAFKQPVRREEALFAFATACWQDHLARSAVHALTELIDMARRSDSTSRLAYGLIWRADILDVLGSHERAVVDLTDVRGVMSGANGTPFAENIGALADAAEGRILASTEPDKALSSLRRALPYFERTIPSLLPALRVQVARILRARGSDVEAEAELEAAIRQIESQGSLLDAQQQRLVYFDYEAAAPFDEMVALQLDTRGDPVRALRYIERSRGRQIADSLPSRTSGGQRRAGSNAPSEAIALAPDSLQSRLPAGVALVYYVVMPDRVAAWVLGDNQASFFRLTVAPDELKRQLAAYDLAIAMEAPIPAMREQAGRLYDDLLRPLLPALRGRDSLVLVADSFLGSVPFASLWNRQTGRHLVEDFRLIRSPNGSAFVNATAAATRAGRSRPLRMLAVGSPRLAPGTGLAPLRGSEIEAREVAQLYPLSELLLDSTATKSAFLAGLGHSDVVHFAGHSTQGELVGSGRLLLAPESGARTGGVLRSDEIASSDLKHTRLVVLAGCRTATGEHSRFEGALGVTRPFLAAGVPMVVASLWDLDDSAGRDFFVEFHRRFMVQADAATSVRLAQLALLRGNNPHRAHPSKWAGFVAFGGILLQTAPALKSEPAL